MGRPQRCPVCFWPLDDHPDRQPCQLSANGEKRAAMAREKHVINADYSPVMYYGAMPRSPRKPVACLMTDEEATEFEHHGQTPTFTSFFDKALVQHRQNLANQQIMPAPAAAANLQANNNDVYVQPDHHDQDPSTSIPSNQQDQGTVTLPDSISSTAAAPRNETVDVLPEEEPTPSSSTDHDQERAAGEEAGEGARGTPDASI